MRCLLRSLAHFLMRLFAFLLSSFKNSLCILDNNPVRCAFCKYFLPVCVLSSHSLNIVFHRSEVFHLNEVQFINYFFHVSWLWCYNLKSHCYTQCHLGFLVFSYVISGELQSFVFYIYIHRSMNNFNLIFVKTVISVFRFIFLIWMTNCSMTICWRDYLFSIVLLLFLLCQRYDDYIYEGLFLGSLFISLI